MTEFLDRLFGPTTFTPHGYCLHWDPNLIALHAMSDAAIALAYFAIPLGIVSLGKRRGDFSGGTLVVAGLFTAFIVACGVTHLGGLLTLWWPYYGIEGIGKAATAVISLASAMIFWQLLPQLAAIPSPAAAEAMNRRLLQEARRREEAYAALEQGRAELERIVQERTEELRRTQFLFEAATRGARITVAAQDRELRYSWIHNPRYSGETEAVVGRRDADLLPPGPRETAEACKRHCLETGELGRFEMELQDGDETAWYDVHVSPLRDADGKIEGVVSAAIDVTRAKRLELLRADLARRLGATLQRFDLALRSGHVLVFSQDAELRYVWSHAETTQVGPVVGRTDEELFAPADRARIIELKRTALESGTPQHGEVRVEGGGGVRWYELFVEPEIGPDGQATGITCAAVDVTVQKEHARQLRVVMRELTHRSKNLLAVVQSVARLTAKQARDVGEFRTKFEQRLRALAGTQDLLVAENWTTVTLDALIRNQVGHYMGESVGRMRIEGPTVHLSPEATQALGLALHELATNAAKYGALSNDAGLVSVAWNVTSRGGQAMLDLAWRETGGPPVHPPERSGFGRIVIERNVALALDADVSVEFHAAGLVARFVIPLRRLTATLDDPVERVVALRGVS